MSRPYTNTFFDPRVLSAAAMVLLALGCGSYAGGTSGAANRNVGSRLSTLQLQGLTGDTESINLSQLEGRVAMIHFWGTWCPPCVRELPHFAELNETYADDPNFVLLAVSSATDIYPNIDQLRQETDEFLTRRGIDLPTYADVNDRTRSSFERVAGWRGYPATMIIDGDGVIRGVWLEYKDGDITEMSELIGQLLAT